MVNDARLTYLDACSRYAAAKLNVDVISRLLDAVREKINDPLSDPLKVWFGTARGDSWNNCGGGKEYFPVDRWPDAEQLAGAFNELRRAADECRKSYETLTPDQRHGLADPP